MPYDAETQRTYTLASAYGYRIPEQVPITEFKVGDGVIVITNKGEPVVSGQISEIIYPDDKSEYPQPGYLRVGEQVYHASSYMFRHL